MRDENLIIIRSYIYAFFPLVFAMQPVMACEKYQIYEIQKVLNLAGYDAGFPDGVVGPKTKKA